MQKEPSCSVSGNVNWCSDYEEQWKFLKKLKIELPYDSAIPILGICLEESIIQRETCTTVFTAALFTIAKTQKQPQSPLTDEWIKKIWYI